MRFLSVLGMPSWPLETEIKSPGKRAEQLGYSKHVFSKDFKQFPTWNLPVGPNLVEKPYQFSWNQLKTQKTKKINKTLDSSLIPTETTFVIDLDRFMLIVGEFLYG